MANPYRFKTIRADDGWWEVRLPYSSDPMSNTHLVGRFTAQEEAYQYAKFRNISRSHNYGCIDTKPFIKLLEDKFDEFNGRPRRYH